MMSAPLEIGLSLGANLGDRAAALIDAVKRLRAGSDWMEQALSAIYETEPVEVPDRFSGLAYYNAVAIGWFSGRDLARLSDWIHRIEADGGRVRGPERNAPRPLDIDVIYAGTRVIAEPDLRVPHPRWVERRFVVEPLAEVRPDLCLPGQRETTTEILRRLPVRPAVRRLTIPGWPP